MVGAHETMQALDFRALFEGAPGLYLVLAPDRDLTILGASDAYLQATMTKRESIVGRALFDVFPDNPADPEATGSRNVAASIARAMATRKPDTMAIQKYDVRRPDGEFEQRWWAPVNTPVLDETGGVRYIIHRVEDVTELVIARSEGVALEARIAAEQQRADLRFRDLVDLAPDGVVACDKNGTILLVNVAAEKMFGYPRAELIGKPIEVLIPERYRARHGGHIAGYAAAPSPRPMGSGLELTGLRKDGSEFPVEISLSPMRGDGGLTISAAIRDITGRRAIERDLQHLAAIVDTSEDAIITETLAGDVTSWNASAERMFGYSAKEILGRSIAILLRDGTLDDERAMLDAIARGEKVAAFETQRRRKNGTLIDVSIRLSALYEHGRVVGASKVVRDISERKRMEAAARRANAYLASAVETIQDAFAIYDERDRVVLVNSSFRRTFGAGLSGPITGQTFASIIDACVRAGVFATNSVEDLRAKLIAYHRAPSGTIEVRTTASQIFRLYEQHTPEGGTVALYVDVTTEAIREDELRTARLQAEAASAAKSEFLSSMSHELRTPLNAILGFTELVRRDRKEPLSARQLDRLGHVQRGGEHLLRLIDDILDLSRIEAGRVTISSEPVGVTAVVDEVVAQLGPMASREEISVQRVDGVDGDPKVRADRTRLSQILMNFGSNAIKYGRAGGRASFRITRPARARVRVAMIDNGLGIPEDKRDKIFEPFQRAGQEAGPIEGTGIGLAISKRLAEMMGGAVGFTSEAGRGSEFWIELPEVVESMDHAGAASARDARESPLAREGERYLLVYIEDNPSNISLMQAIVEDLRSITMLSAPTAELGLELIRARQPDVVLMDINLPGMSGIEAKRRLGEDPATRGIPVIALSAAALPGDTARANTAGFARYITKPVRVDELTAALEDILGMGSR